MEEQLNNELNNRIKEVFDGYELPAEAADAGWAELSKRFPAERKGRAAAWWWGSAAAVLVLVIFTLWLTQRSDNNVVKFTQHPSHPAKPGLNHPHQIDQVPGPLKGVPQQQIAAVTQPQYGQHIHVPASQKGITFQTNTTTSRNTVAPLGIDTINLNRGHVLVDITHPQDSLAAKTTASVINAGASGQQVYTATSVGHKDSVHNAKVSGSMAELLANDAKSSYKPKVVKSTNPKLTFSVFAGTYLNYAKGSSNQLNAGAGVSSDIKLTKNFKLVTGIAIAQNSLKYDGQPMQPNVYAAAIAATAPPVAANSTLRLFSMPAFSPSSVSTTTVSTQINGYNASFTGLDIPVNLKYELNPGKTDSYVSAGISSSTFINETYRYNYTNTLVASTSASAETQARFASFDFARTLNVSFGVGTPLGKSNRLIIEPFLKYPLSGLGSQQIRFGASGINLKLKFQSHK